MKMNKKLLLTASVFFVLLFVLGCGIATVFYVQTTLSYSNENKYISITDNDDSENLLWITPNTGPSLFLGYIVTDSAAGDSYRSAFNTEFRRVYQKNNFGIHINKSILAGRILSVNNPELGLYSFNGSAIQAPTYHATAIQRESPSTSFKIEKQDISSDTIQLVLDFPLVGSYAVASGSLLRFNNKAFSTSKDGDDPDYIVEDPPGPNLYCHLYGAINVGEGSFNNIYWSDLFYLGSIKLSTEVNP